MQACQKAISIVCMAAVASSTMGAEQWGPDYLYLLTGHIISLVRQPFVAIPTINNGQT